MTLLIASVRPAHHPHKSGLSAECIWKQHVKLLRSGGAKSWAGSIRQRSSSGMSASTEDRSCVWLWPMQANLQSATCPGRRRRRGRGRAVICRSGLHNCTMLLLDYCGADAQPGCLRRARRHYAVPTQYYAPAGPFHNSPLSNSPENSPKPLISSLLFKDSSNP